MEQKRKTDRAVARSLRRAKRSEIVAAPSADAVVETNENQVITSNLNIDENYALEALLLLRDGGQSVDQRDIEKIKVDVGVQTDPVIITPTQHVEVQVNTSDAVTVVDFVQNEKQLNSLTGLNSFALLNSFVKLLGLIRTDKKVHRLTLEKRVFLVFMKLKLDLPYVVLSVLFGVSGQTCKNIFFETVPLLAAIAVNAIPYPSMQEIRQNMPKCFRDFTNVRTVLDCTEIHVQQHKRLCCRVKCYSHYKGSTTIKFMTGVTPAGLISYVSPAYGGRASDSSIFQQSNLLQRMHEGEAIMVDKGFLIEDPCRQYLCDRINQTTIHETEKAVFSRRITSERKNSLCACSY